MTPASVRIGVVDDAHGFLVTLPAQFWLVVGLRKTFHNVQGALEPWTYRVPAGRRRSVELEAWIAEVELQARAEARRRSWTATDAEWLGAGEPRAPLPMPAEPAVVTLPKKRTARAVLNLLADLTGSAVLVVSPARDRKRAHRAAGSLPGAEASGARRPAGPRQKRPLVADGSRRAAPRSRGGGLRPLRRPVTSFAIFDRSA